MALSELPILIQPELTSGRAFGFSSPKVHAYEWKLFSLVDRPTDWHYVSISLGHLTYLSHPSKFALSIRCPVQATFTNSWLQSSCVLAAGHNCCLQRPEKTILTLSRFLCIRFCLVPIT